MNTAKRSQKLEWATQEISQISCLQLLIESHSITSLDTSTELEKIPGCEIVTGGGYDDKTGYFIEQLR